MAPPVTVPARAGTLPYSVQRLALPGPVTGVAVRIDLADPRVAIEVALADDNDPDGDGPCAAALAPTSEIARRRGYDITLNASFFAAPKAREYNGPSLRYYHGNCAWPVGWHHALGRTVGRAKDGKIDSTLIVHESGRVTLADGVKELPPGTRYAVSGNAMMLKAGQVTPPAVDTARHPRSAVGLTADARTLILLALDGRQEESRGATLAELGAILRDLGAHDAINLDGGGSTSLVLKDPGSGTYAIANRPSDLSSLKIPLRVERPVVDVVGVRFRGN